MQFPALGRNIFFLPCPESRDPSRPQAKITGLVGPEVTKYKMEEASEKSPTKNKTGIFYPVC